MKSNVVSFNRTPRQCVHCLNTFIPTVTHHRYCVPECRRLHHISSKYERKRLPDGFTKNDIDFGAIVKLARIECGLSVKQLAHLVDYKSERSIRYIELNKKTVTVDKFYQILIVTRFVPEFAKLIKEDYQQKKAFCGLDRIKHD